MSSGRASAQAPGFDSGSTIGTGSWSATSRTRASVKAPEQAVAPISTVDPATRAMATGSTSSDGRSPASRSASGIDGERPLIVRQCRAIRMDEAVAVEHHDGRSRGAWVHALGDELALQEGGDADRRATRADEHEAVGGQAPTLSASSEETREDDRSGSLDVVIEARLPVPVAVEDAHRIVSLEVLPLDDGRREHPGHGVHERLDDRIVCRAAQARRPVTDVERIVQELAAVGPDIERDGQRLRRIDPAAAVYRASLPTGIAIPPAPWSPRPRMRSLSVTTIRRMSSPADRRMTSIRPTSSGVIQTPRGRRMMWLNCWQARPTVGV